MFKLRSLYPLCALAAAASLFAQDVPPPPRAPAKPPADPVSEPKVNVPRSTKEPAAAPAPVPVPAAEPAPKSRVRTQRVPVATPLPVDPNEPKKRGFWDKVLGRKGKSAQTPKPVAKSTPTPKPTRVRPKTDRPAPATPAPTEKRIDKRSAPEPKATPEAKPAPAPKATPAPKPSKSSKPQPAPKVDATPGADVDTETAERTKFTDAKTKAMEDAEVQELKLKADTASSEEEARKAMRTYNKALFRKMRSIDPSIKERIDATEAAIMRRLGE